MRRCAVLLLVVLGTGCGGTASTLVSGGDADNGKSDITAYGCGGCHQIPDVGQADGRIGPSLAGLAHRRYIAGRLTNTPDNLVRWIVDPQGVSPGTLMPDLDVTDQAARDIAAYLYTH
jgi:cytochrome c2